jgi:hypothetical protein
MASDEFGNLSEIHKDFPNMNLVQAMENDFTRDHPRNLYRSWDMQASAYGAFERITGRSPHGTGCVIDVPLELVNTDDKNEAFRQAIKQFGFIQYLGHPGALGNGQPDARHFFYVGNYLANFPTASSHMGLPAFREHYKNGYSNWNLERKLPQAINFPRPQDLEVYIKNNKTLEEARI